METNEARSILAVHLSGYRRRSYAELASWVRQGRVDTAQEVGPAGCRYQIEVQFFWDGRPESDVRVSASIDDGGIRAFCPLNDCFIVSSGGKFVGE